MNKKTLCFIVLFQLYAFNLQAFRSFEESWNNTQTNYLQLRTSLKTLALDESRFSHPFWLETQKKLHAIVMGPANPNVLKEQIIQHTMVRMGFSTTQAYEESYLLKSLSPQTTQLIKSFKDIDFPFLPRECSALNCSSSSLGHLFYAAKTLEAWKEDKAIEIIVEFGGGYGNLAHIYKKLLPKTTIIILDLPETIALQKLFLDIALPETETIIHCVPPQEFEKGAIHLVPIFFIDELAIKADIFVSTFAISEAPKYVQQLVINQHFFHAPACYIVGQFDGWNGMFENHDLIMKGVNELYSSILCQPFHIQIGALKNYELLGVTQILGK